MKTLGITVDTWKVNGFRKELIKRGYTIEFDGAFNHDVHLFRVQCEDNEFQKVKERMFKDVREIELKLKRSN
jgi:hypothetical protein